MKDLSSFSLFHHTEMSSESGDTTLASKRVNNYTAVFPATCELIPHSEITENVLTTTSRLYDG
jgi:hypothetical protein